MQVSSPIANLDLGCGALFHRVAHPIPAAGDRCGDADHSVLLPQDGGRLLWKQRRVADRSLFGKHHPRDPGRSHASHLLLLESQVVSGWMFHSQKGVPTHGGGCQWRLYTLRHPESGGRDGVAEHSADVYPSPPLPPSFTHSKCLYRRVCILQTENVSSCRCVFYPR